MKVLALLALSLFPSNAKAYNGGPTQRYVTEMLSGAPADRAQVSDEALDSMVSESTRQLWKYGYPELAERLGFEWEHTFKGFLRRVGDEGDHSPLSAWLAVWYMTLEATLGDRALEMTHLVDIKTFNFAIPVVFHPHAEATWCKEQLAQNPKDTCAEEYRRHFAGTKYITPDPYAELPLHNGLAGVTTYWLVFAGCETALWGLDWTLLCGLAGDLSERSMDKVAAPGISAKLWLRNNP